MAYNFASKYPGRWAAATTAKPLGVAKNRTAETSKDGSYMEKTLFDEWTHVIAGVLSSMGVMPDNADDVVGDSQYIRALKSMMSGGAQTYVDSGTGSSYQLSASHGEPITDLFNGFTVRFFANSDSQASALVNVSSIGNKPIKLTSGAAIKAQSIRSGELVELMYKLSDDAFVLISTDYTEGTGKLIWGTSATVSPESRCIKADGSAINRTTYAALFAKMGTVFGGGDGSTTFNLPDLRGEFVRGWDDGRGIDAGRVFGSLQKGTIIGYDQGYDAVYNVSTGLYESDGQREIGVDEYNLSDYQNVRIAGILTQSKYDLPGSSGGYSGVARPRNIALTPWIKY